MRKPVILMHSLAGVLVGVLPTKDDISAGLGGEGGGDFDPYTSAKPEN